MLTARFTALIIVFVVIAQFMGFVKDSQQNKSLDILEQRVNQLEAQLEQYN